MCKISDCFGCDVFDSRAMKSMLPEKVYERLNQTFHEGKPLDGSIANEVADAMKKWAIEHGATHYSHWFQPMTGITAEKHDSFIEPSRDGGIRLEFSSKELIHGEPDASSFPSGGLRSTFEARGYTAWDPTSYAFLKGKTLCIPTAYCSYDGKALDQKTPLLRSMDAISKQAVRILRLFGDKKTSRVLPMVGVEQEYFLVDREIFNRRRDLMQTGRTLFGARPPKGQELDNHFFGAIKPRVQAFMDELNDAMWRLGIPAKTEHNEAAPSQHELASVYETANIATDHNQQTMELMHRIAGKHGLVCLLHEKPFEYVNGSGKHSNWSLATDDGVNLLSPGKTPFENAQFLLFLVAVIKAADDYAEILRTSVASAGNDHRLGGNEAPPAIISIYLGSELSGILDAIENDLPYGGTEKKLLKLGVDAVPVFVRDSTDRNRTSPLAFTGNKFEFRMPGSESSVAMPNCILNAAVADTLRIFADTLEGADDFETALHELIRKTVHEHKRILFDGNGYDEAWMKEATDVRGLPNLCTTADCIAHITSRKSIEMLSRMGIFTEEELRARGEILSENYVKTVMIEARMMLDMVKKDILPALMETVRELGESVVQKKQIIKQIDCTYETDRIVQLNSLMQKIHLESSGMENTLAAVKGGSELQIIRDTLLGEMTALRSLCDEAEVLCPKTCWPFPTYDELLFSVEE